ncbi:DNA replication/repair protein RecF [Alkalithermobacter paradoxus]|uniref:DNA replication and repair protein RecF n=1 Tax=Alkalithermobacter paradoxus TaxID=29349 RepID=A0A1V4I6G0_9FIRM|nr:DNA replication and repair protein RecF [[Clostridium] thermoalcaliphilum]
MYIENLRIINFRNYDEAYLKFNKHINLLLGRNGQGKTNILEAIYMLSIGKSFRTNKDGEIVKFGKENSYIGGSYVKYSRNNTIEIGLRKNNKKGIKINKVSIDKIGHILGKFNVVVFSPEDLRLVKEGPSERRKFIDREISQIIPKYYNHLYNYNKILGQRNKVLKNVNVDAALLDVFDDSLSNEGAWIYIYRRRFVDKIKMLSKQIHDKLTDGVENLDIKYISQIDIQRDDSHESIKSRFYEKLKNNIQSDIMNKVTKIGPHRDDIQIIINDLDVKLYGSQGQQRTAAISLKLSQIELINEEVKEYPVVLLDDIFSELDEKRQKLLIDSLGEIQIFITSAEEGHKKIFEDKQYDIFRVENGQIS